MGVKRLYPHVPHVSMRFVKSSSKYIHCSHINQAGQEGLGGDRELHIYCFHLTSSTASITLMFKPR